MGARALRDMYGVRGAVLNQADQPQQDPIPLVPHELHPAVQNMAIHAHETAIELDRLRVQNQALINKIEIEKRLNESLEGEIKRLREQLDYYMAYAIEFKTRAEHVMTAAETLQQSALRMARGTVMDAKLNEVETAIGEIVASKVTPELVAVADGEQTR